MEKIYSGELAREVRCKPFSELILVHFVCLNTAQFRGFNGFSMIFFHLDVFDHFYFVFRTSEQTQKFEII